MIDQTSGQVWRGEQALNPTPIEFRLKSYLARHPGLALTRSQMIDAVWG
ncbi:MAG: winged helix-turn-helix domain-containing protein [Chloroflexi bacterium]|nr:winged helix-turn-helix domain-containing protein [Chloroflexota bacterium]